MLRDYNGRPLLSRETLTLSPTFPNKEMEPTHRDMEREREREREKTADKQSSCWSARAIG